MPYFVSFRTPQLLRSCRSIAGRYGRHALSPKYEVSSLNFEQSKLPIQILELSRAVQFVRQLHLAAKSPHDAHDQRCRMSGTLTLCLSYPSINPATSSFCRMVGPFLLDSPSICRLGYVTTPLCTSDQAQSSTSICLTHSHVLILSSYHNPIFASHLSKTLEAYHTKLQHHTLFHHHQPNA